MSGQETPDTIRGQPAGQRGLLLAIEDRGQLLQLSDSIDLDTGEVVLILTYRRWQKATVV